MRLRSLLRSQGVEKRAKEKEKESLVPKRQVRREGCDELGLHAILG